MGSSPIAYIRYSIYFILIYNLSLFSITNLSLQSYSLNKNKIEIFTSLNLPSISTIYSLASLAKLVKRLTSDQVTVGSSPARCLILPSLQPLPYLPLTVTHSYFYTIPYSYLIILILTFHSLYYILIIVEGGDHIYYTTYILTEERHRHYC